MAARGENEKRARINLRPFLLCALSLAFGISLCGSLRLGGFSPSDLILPLLIVLFAFFPFSKRRILFLALCFPIAAGVGALAIHLRIETYTARAEAGEYRLSGTVEEATQKRGYCVAVLRGLAFDGTPRSGKCRVYLSGDVRAGDELTLTARVSPVDTDGFFEDSFTRYLFAEGINYTASASETEKTGRSHNPFLLLDSALYDRLHDNMERDEADVAYALLTGSPGSIESGLSDSMRQGGIAHIFAVSGLHIGILYGAAYFIFKPLRRYRFLPALALAVLYAALCGFSVSSVRALLTCAFHGANGALGRKPDFLSSVSLAAALILLFSPAEWYSVGLRLSFGAALGLALLGGQIGRLLRRIRLPKALSGYLGASLSVQIFTFPVMIESFGYVSAWGTALNLLVVPLLPVLFLGLLLCTAFALAIPPAASFFLFFPEKLLSLFLLLFSWADFSFVITGFALGTGGVVLVAGMLALSEKFRLKTCGKAVAAIGLSVLFSAILVSENVVFSGCRLDVYARENRSALLVRTAGERVLVLDGRISVSDCEDFLRRLMSGTLTAAVVIGNDEEAGINIAAFLPAEGIRARDEIETGLSETPVFFGREFSYGSLSFRYEGPGKLLLLTENVAVEIDFTGPSALGADLFIGGARGRYYLKDGQIRQS